MELGPAKRILMLNYEYPPLGGGGGVAARQLAQGFVALGYKVDYLTSGVKGLAAEEMDAGVRVIRVPVIGRRDRAAASLISMACYVVLALWRGYGLCRRHSYALINTHFVVPTGPVGWLLARWFRLPNLLSLHGGDLYDPSKRLSPHRHRLLRWFVRFLLHRAEYCVAQSSDTRQRALSYYRPDRPVEIIPLAYTACRFEPCGRKVLGLDPGVFYLVAAGRLVPRKGFDTLLRALALLPEQVRLVIIGDGPEQAALTELAGLLGLSGRVTLTGYVDEARKFQYLQACDAYVLSSLHEGFGIVIQEAMQVGLPVIATNVGGQVDLVEEGRNGWLVEPGNAQALADGIQRLLRDPSQAKAMGETGRARLDEFRPAAIASAYLNLLKPAPGLPEKQERNETGR